MNERTALIVGASRGLGLGVTQTLLQRGWTVTATARSASPGLQALAAPALHVEMIDINHDAAVADLRRRMDGQTFDLVFVVAGISREKRHKASDVPRDTVTEMFQTNTVSPIRFAEAFCSLIKPGGTLALMTSTLGSVTLNTVGSWEVYRGTKAALNTFARSMFVRHKDDGWDLVLMHPGWVRTEMGGDEAPLDITTSVTGMVDVLEKHGRTGCNYLDYKGETLPW